MKKFKLSLIIIVAVLTTAILAFTTKSSSIADGWYAQKVASPPYSFADPVSLSDVNTNCPAGTTKICAVDVVNGSVSTTRMSSHYYP